MNLKINVKINFNFIFILNKLVHIKKFNKDFNKNNFDFYYLNFY